MNQPAGPFRADNEYEYTDYGRCQIAEYKEVVNAKQVVIQTGDHVI
jgi:hypothetical protein